MNEITYKSMRDTMNPETTISIDDCGNYILHYNNGDKYTISPFDIHGECAVASYDESNTSKIDKLKELANLSYSVCDCGMKCEKCIAIQLLLEAAGI